MSSCTHMYTNTEKPLITNAGTAVVFHAHRRKKKAWLKNWTTWSWNWERWHSPPFHTHTPPPLHCKHTFTSQNATKEVTCSPRSHAERIEAAPLRMACRGGAGGRRLAGNEATGDLESNKLNSAHVRWRYGKDGRRDGRRGGRGGKLRSPYLSRLNFYFPAKLEVMNLLKWWTVFLWLKSANTCRWVGGREVWT